MGWEVSVNIAAPHFHRPNFVQRLKDILHTCPEVSPSRLELEILESAALEDMQYMRRMMQSCQDLGVRFALDDFGTGFSSLSYLKRLPAETIKIEVGAAMTELDAPPPDFAVRGRDLMTGIPKEITVTYSEIAQALDKSISKIEEAILSALEATPPELSADIYKTGIYLAGGGALLRGLDKRISIKTKLPVHVSEDPLRAVARGTGIALKNIDRFQFLMRE